jgi:ADP-heptose:LPS heptosyltransferase
MPLERIVRGLWARAISLTLPRPLPGAAARAHRVLLLRHDAIGDMLSSLGVIRALARHGLAVDVLASPANAAVLTGNPWGVGVLQTATTRAARRSLAATLAERRYDAVIDGLVLKPGVNSRTVRLLRASGAAVRVGSGGRRNDFVYTHPVVANLAANHVEVLAALLTPFGIAAELALEPVAMPLSDDERSAAGSWWAAGGDGTRLFVNLSASGLERRWPDERFIGSLRSVAGQLPGLRIVVSGSPSDWPAAAAVAEATGGRAFAGPLRAAFAVVAESDVVLTPDTSVAHAAAGFGVPSVVLTPQGNLRFAPWRANTRLVIARGRGIDVIREDDVVTALLDLLAVQQGESG